VLAADNSYGRYITYFKQEIELYFVDQSEPTRHGAYEN
jgi:hypothetical protein